MNRTFSEIFGWYGVVAIILAYALLSFGYLSQYDAAFHILNATGAVGIIIDSLKQKNYQPAVLNMFWFVIGLVALIKILI